MISISIWIVIIHTSENGFILTSTNENETININTNISDKKDPVGSFWNIPIYKHLDWALGTLWAKFAKDYSETIQIKSFGQKNQIPCMG